MATAENLISFWNKLNQEPDTDGHYIHPDDRALLPVTTRPGYQSDFEYLTSDGIKTKLVPSPYQGDLRSARVIVCMLNPGVGLNSLHEVRNKKFRQAMFRQLKQEFKNTDHKFLSLDPEFCWTGGFKWWFTKFGALVREIEKSGFTIKQSLQMVANNIAAVELFAYPSKSFKHRNLITRYELTSTRKIKSWMKAEAEKGVKKIIVVRSAENWDLKQTDNIEVMHSNYSRGGWFINNGNREVLAKDIINGR